MRDVILISFTDTIENLGIKYLHAYISSKGYESSILFIPQDRRHQNTLAALDFVTEAHPSILGFSIMTSEFWRAIKFAEMARSKLRDSTFIFGGSHATSDTESCLIAADAVVRGEGEETLLELVQAYHCSHRTDISNIKGIAFKREGETVYTPLRQPIQSIDNLPYPRHLPESMFVTHKGYIRSVKAPCIVKHYIPYKGIALYVLTSRGCPLRCSFCYNSILFSLYGKANVRFRSADSVIDEIKQETSNYKDIAFVVFQDECFMTHPIDWLAEFSEKYSRMINLPFFIKTIPSYVTREKLILLKRAGLRWVSMGLQTGSDRINKEIYRREVTAEAFLKAAAAIVENKCLLSCDVITNNPYETELDYLKTIETLLKMPQSFVLKMFPLRFWPGTELTKRAQKDNILKKHGKLPPSKPKFLMINAYIRLSALLPKRLTRLLIQNRGNRFGKIACRALWRLSPCIEFCLYSWLVYRSNHYNMRMTLRILKRLISKYIKHYRNLR